MEDVHEKLLGLNPGKSVGPDNIHPRVLKEAADFLVVPLTNIFQHSFEIGLLLYQYKNGSRHCQSAQTIIVL